MIFIKSILAGLLSLALGAFLSLVGVVISFAVFAERDEGTLIAIDPISVARSLPLLWLLPVLFFSLGFAWEYRRAKARRAKQASTRITHG